MTEQNDMPLRIYLHPEAAKHDSFTRKIHGNDCEYIRADLVTPPPERQSLVAVLDDIIEYYENEYPIAEYPNRDNLTVAAHFDALSVEQIREIRSALCPTQGTRNERVRSDDDQYICRSEFERWFSDDYSSPKAIERDGGEGYKLLSAQNNWQAWKAAWNAKGAAAPKNGGA